MVSKEKVGEIIAEFEHMGFHCLVARESVGEDICGYVGISRGHTWYDEYWDSSGRPTTSEPIKFPLTCDWIKRTCGERTCPEQSRRSRTRRYGQGKACSERSRTRGNEAHDTPGQILSELHWIGMNFGLSGDCGLSDDSFLEKVITLVKYAAKKASEAEDLS